MSDFKFGGIKIDPSAYGSQGSAVLGIRDSGKTYTATELSERLFEAGIPFVAFDPIGVWRFLRVPGHGRGYPVVVAGGQAGDLPLTVASAPEYVRAAMRDGVSLIIDLFDINLSKADWKRIVMASVRVLLHENAKHGLRHVFIEEAAEFAPQRVGPDQGAVYAEIEKLARMGGNSRLGYTLINQRAEEVNKAVLELCDNLFLHRQKGRNSLTALSKWLDIGNVKGHREIIDSLSTLPTGECWAWLAGSERPIRIKVPVKNSLHPDRRVMRGDGDIKAKASVDVGAFVTSMRASLGKIEEEAKANDPAALRKQVVDLKRELAKKASSQADTTATYAARNEGFQEGKRAGAEHERKVIVAALHRWQKSLKGQIHQAIETALNAVTLPPELGEEPHIAPTLKPVSPSPRKGNGSLPSTTKTLPSGEAVDLSPSARKIIDVICRAYPVSLSFDAAARRAVVSKNSSAYGKYRQEVENSDQLERDGNSFRAKPEYAASGGISDAATIDAWASRLPPSYGRMLTAIRDGASTRDEIASAAGVSPTSSGLSAGLGELAKLELVAQNNGRYELAEGLL